MDNLADFSSAGSSLLWLWIIEYLASFKEVDTSILHDLIEMAPEIPDDLAKAPREMVALRCLEDLFGSSDKLSNYRLSATEKKVGFALSENCEDVLQQILQETSTSDLKMAGPELLKWDVHPFIMHKRASMPICALQKLKDTILEGTNPLAASFKESSGLMCVNECGTALIGDLDQNDPSMSEKENFFPSTCENKDGLPGDDLHSRNVLPCKRGRDDMAARDMAVLTNEVQVESGLNYNAKKLKQDAISNLQSAEKFSVPIFGKESVESLSGGDVAVARGEGSQSVNQSHDEGMEESQLPEDGCDNCDDLRRLGQNDAVSDNQIQHNPAVDSHTADEMPQDEPIQNAIMNEASVTEPRTSTCVHSVGTHQEDKGIISKYSMRFRRQEMHYTYPAIPRLRRMTVPWTAKEEEMLKKGVWKFASVDNRTIPWKKILEFGSSVFLRGRTTIDLKDKWRIMCKGSPRSK